MDSNNEKLMEDNVGQVELGSQSPPIEDELAANFPNALSTQDPLVVFTDESDDDETKNDKSDKIGDIFHDGPSSDSEHENDDSNEKGHVLNSMFGENSDSDLGRKSDAETIPDNQKSDEEATLGNGNTSGILVDGREWDFDVMMRQKKAARRKHKRKRDAGIDIINDDDYAVSTLVEEMKAATRDDCRSNQERQPALRKRMLLSEVKLMFLKVDSIETLIDNGMMSAVSDWLSPLPDKSLPGLEVRTELLKLLQSFTRLEPGCLKQSGLGKAVMMLFKHPRETKQNKELANKLIREWSRPIFQLNDDFRSLSREERVERDLKNMPAIKKQRVSEEESVDLTEPGCSTSSNFGSKPYVGRARVPRPSSKDYVLRPKYNVDGQFKGERKSSASYQLDKIQRDFMERARKNKTRRAVRVSVEVQNGKDAGREVSRNDFCGLVTTTKQQGFKFFWTNMCRFYVAKECTQDPYPETFIPRDKHPRRYVSGYGLTFRNLTGQSGTIMWKLEFAVIGKCQPETLEAFDCRILVSFHERPDVQIIYVEV